MSAILINIDVPDVEAASVFYRDAFGLAIARRLGRQAVELTGWPAPVYLLENAAGTPGAGGDRRRYDRHWTPLHLDVVVDDLDAAIARAVAAGAKVETPIHAEAYGLIAVLADPYGHGWCLLQFTGRGYDALIVP